MSSSLSSSIAEVSTFGPLMEFQELQPLHCSKDALTDFFGWILQILLAGIAFSCLIGESTYINHCPIILIGIIFLSLQCNIAISKKILWAALQTTTLEHLVDGHFQARHWSCFHSHDKRRDITYFQRRSMYMVKNPVRKLIINSIFRINF